MLTRLSRETISKKLLIKNVYEAFAKNRFDLVLNLCNNILVRYPHSFECWYIKGYAFYKQKKYLEAAKAFYQAILSDLTHHNTHEILLSLNETEKFFFTQQLKFLKEILAKFMRFTKLELSDGSYFLVNHNINLKQFNQKINQNIYIQRINFGIFFAAMNLKREGLQSIIDKVHVPADIIKDFFLKKFNIISWKKNISKVNLYNAFASHRYLATIINNFLIKQKKTIIINFLINFTIEDITKKSLKKEKQQYYLNYTVKLTSKVIKENKKFENNHIKKINLHKIEITKKINLIKNIPRFSVNHINLPIIKKIVRPPSIDKKYEYQNNYIIEKNKIILHEEEKKYLEKLILIKPDEIKAYFVGGLVRGRLLNSDYKPNDYDIVTNASMAQIEQAYPSAKHLQLKLFRVMISQNFHIDIWQNLELSDLKRDALNRDFTINALYSDINGSIYDPLKLGMIDLENLILSAIIPAKESFKYDPVRILRAIYIADHVPNLKMSFDILNEIKHFDLKIREDQCISINSYFNKLFRSDNLVNHFIILREAKLLSKFFPELDDNTWMNPWLINQLKIVCSENKKTQQWISLSRIYILFAVSAASLSFDKEISYEDVNSILNQNILFKKNFSWFYGKDKYQDQHQKYVNDLIFSANSWKLENSHVKVFKHYISINNKNHFFYYNKKILNQNNHIKSILFERK